MASFLLHVAVGQDTSNLTGEVRSELMPSQSDRMSFCTSILREFTRHYQRLRITLLSCASLGSSSTTAPTRIARALFNAGWPDGLSCTRCGSGRFCRPSTRRTTFQCNHCKRQLSPLAGTLFLATKLPRTKQSERFEEVTTRTEALRCKRTALGGSESVQAVTQMSTSSRP